MDAKGSALRSAETASVFSKLCIPRDRIVLAEDVPTDVHEERLRHANIGLDTRLYGGIPHAAISSGCASSFCPFWVHGFTIGSPIA